jgi:hypothetical protein
MTRAGLLAPVALLAMAASPVKTFLPSTPMPDFNGSAQGQRAPASTAPPGYDVAPTPNQDAFAPITRASKDASVAPGIFNRTNQYRGQGISPDSSAQIEEDRRVKPGAGIKLNFPLD